MQISAKVKYGKLQNIINAMAKDHKVKVGLLAEKGGSDSISDDLDLAGLGAIHEFGCQIPVTDKMRGFFFHQFGINLKKSTTHIIIPSRSFLQMPLERRQDLRRKLQDKLGESENVLEYIEQTGDSESIAVLLGTAAVEQIMEAFESGGWGQWEPNSGITSSQKGSALPLVDTGNLKQHITYEVE
jgi:phage gpG-like protein